MSSGSLVNTRLVASRALGSGHQLLPHPPQGIGHALVHRVLDWAHGNGHETVSVDFDSPNPLSRPFWLGAGFTPTGYGVARTIQIP